MKTKLSYFFLLTISLFNAQNITFADVNFKNVLLPFNDSNNDGQISITEAQNITSIFIDTNQNVTNLAGIEFLPNLTSLLIKNNVITNPVNLSQNTNLYNIQLQNMVVPSANITGLPLLKYLSIGVGYGQSLDLSGKPLLETVTITGDPYTGGITSLNTTGCTALKSLWLQYTSILSINTTQNPNLETLVVQKFNTSPGGLSSVNLTQNPLLKSISILGQSTFTSINVSSNPILETLNVGGNALTSLNLDSNPLLKFLSITSNNFSGGLDVTNNPLLEELHAPQANLNSLNLSTNINLKTLSITNNYIPQINFNPLTQLSRLDAGNNLFTSIDLSNNANLKYVGFLGNQQMKYINLKNGNNQNIIWQTNSDYQFMPQLTGICVDNITSSYGIKVKQAVASNVLVTANCSLLSTQENKNSQKKLMLYPVPAENFLNIQTDEIPLEYKIFSVAGQKVQSEAIKNGEKSVNVKNLIKGIYMIEVKTKRNTYKEKFLKK